ncbi:hypothetical protein PH5382_00670 [Phaeobacter sp. CECT 5382]|uniref:SGNH/GDSL hydrolase family protein n=1 Tax=Phaeobacter sp. CECT 5382 TaxID=1712645 RepID=UPI0006D96E44|nr:SGNH/GDSL hydrolase family protein [Phaeobacter sp. CECT 5382]CUH86757.1 hypothetical protein PH5382_00670 [Phaeobacter sp. CECT 5382]
MIAVDQILRLPLLPLLVAQGMAVRRRAMILPEPDGLREGRQGRGRLLRVLIAGDSSAAGVGVSDQSVGLSGQLAAHLSPHFDLIWRLEATTGHQTRDTLARLAALPKQHFDVVVLALGVNDVTHGTSRRAFFDQQSELIHLLSTRFAPGLILACGVPQMQLFPALPQPLAWVLGRQSARLDGILAGLDQDHDHVAHIPFQLPQDPDLAAEDGYHPSARAYALWAGVLAEKIRDRYHSSR